MAPVPVFHGAVDDRGQLALSAAEREQRRTYLRGLAGKTVEVIVRKVRTKRSLDMNAYLHAVPFPILAEHFGDDIEGVKFDVMGECWGWRSTKGGQRIPVKGHTSDMTVEESTYFVDWLIPWALVNHGVVIPLPNEVDA